MDIVGGRKYVEIPGGSVHELPPLLLKGMSADLARTLGLAEQIIESDSLIPDVLADQLPELNLQSRKYGLAINLAEHYVTFLTHWCWGESILEWIRQCEITFQTKPNLRPLLRPDVWPHADRSSFVTLLEDKDVPREGVDIENAVGYRLTFRQPPPIDFFSEKFLFLLNASVAEAAYDKWSSVTDAEAASLPPERFHFVVMGSEIKEV